MSMAPSSRSNVSKQRPPSLATNTATKAVAAHQTTVLASVPTAQSKRNLLATNEIASQNAYVDVVVSWGQTAFASIFAAADAFPKKQHASGFPLELSLQGGSTRAPEQMDNSQVAVSRGLLGFGNRRQRPICKLQVQTILASALQHSIALLPLSSSCVMSSSADAALLKTVILIRARLASVLLGSDLCERPKARPTAHAANDPVAANFAKKMCDRGAAADAHLSPWPRAGAFAHVTNSQRLNLEAVSQTTAHSMLRTTASSVCDVSLAFFCFVLDDALLTHMFVTVLTKVLAVENLSLGKVMQLGKTASAASAAAQTEAKLMQAMDKTLNAMWCLAPPSADSTPQLLFTSTKVNDNSESSKPRASGIALNWRKVSTATAASKQNVTGLDKPDDDLVCLLTATAGELWAALSEAKRGDCCCAESIARHLVSRDYDRDQRKQCSKTQGCSRHREARQASPR